MGFVDGDLVEAFLDLERGVRDVVCGDVGVGVDDVLKIVQDLARIH